MNDKHSHDQEALDRLFRQNERYYTFLRQSPRDQRWIPFEDDKPVVHTKRNAVLGTVSILVALLLVWVAAE